ncbi:hypothetical protein OEZ86_009073 [Tetradesmus obliquus]|nr:hypothetical protein OEZ86_009073 [Tetradesmus obliquus]
MNRAIGVHNNILRKACHTHAGYVLDQEGDSWTVAFREAEDAVAFSLQVQQALARKAWILPNSDYALPGSTPGLAKPPDVQQYFDTMRAANSDVALSAGENSMTLADTAAANSSLRRQDVPFGQQHSHREPSHAGVSEGSSATKLQKTATFMQRLTGRGSGMGTIGGSSNLGGSTAAKQGPIKVLQLAVRIGIASGLLPYGCDVSECAVKFRAKELVSDVANGGQILLDEPTFLLVKDSLTVLGTVNDAGFDDSMLQQLLQAKVVGRLQEQLACYCRYVSRELSFTGGLLDREPQDYDNDAISTHDLARVLGWAEPVRAKPGWLQVQKSYFSAPGARQMDLTPSAKLQGQTQAPLPDVTVVFAAVEGGEAFISRHSHSEVHALHKAIVHCMGQQLGSLPAEDGYLCRCQESALHYMVAFEQADLAARWCLLVQEALMYIDWPEHVLAHPGFGEVADPASGALLFRGPRLRMGLSEGQPTCVLPDHAGRANYYGASVNRAARYMDAAAHGGQTVTDLPLTRKLFMQWVSQDREAPAGLGSSSSNPALHSDAPSAAAADDDTLLLPAADQQQWMPQLAVPPIAEHQPLNIERSSLSSRQLRPFPAHADAARGSAPGNGGDLARGSPTLLLLAPRRSSETSARYRSLPLDHGWACRHGLYLPLAPALSRQFSLQSSSRGSAAGGIGASEHSSGGAAATAAAAAGMGLVGRSKSYTATRSRPLMDDQMHGDRVAAFVSGLPLALQQQHSIAGSGLARYSVGDCVSALHLGKFMFKGSGEFDMVQLLQAALLGRAEVFPEEPPGGKGERMAGGNAVGGVRDLPDVRLPVSSAVMAARQAFRAFSYGGGRAFNSGYA